MITAMITSSFTGLLRAIVIFLSDIIVAEFAYSSLFFQRSGQTPGHRPATPHYLKNILKLIAQAMGFIFFISHRNYHSIFRRRDVLQNDVLRKKYCKN
jgi:hypothetical protein